MKHVESLLPPDKKWQLVWHDEFDGTLLDTSKWSIRHHMMQQRQQHFSDDCVKLDGKGNLLLTLKKDGDNYYSAQIQTGENYLDRPGAPAYSCARPDVPTRIWPVGKITRPKFQHKYGYYECRCKLQAQPGWWSAFWLQSPVIGCCLDPRRAGVEVDIMESFTRDGVIEHNNHWDGYGEDHKHVGVERKLEETSDGYHVFGCHWSRNGYVFYVDGRESWRIDGPVSDIEQFILLSCECKGYRKTGFPDEELKQAVLPDAFVVDYVRVFDEAVSSQ